MAGVQVDEARGLPAEVVAALREDFACELPGRVAVLSPALDAAACRRAAHALGSSAYVAGEPGLARAAQDLERTIGAGGPWADEAGALARRLLEWAP